MDKFIIKNVSQESIKKELSLVGFDSSYIHQAAYKYRYFNIKIFNLSLPQVNILKQAALSFGADCAVHRDILTAEVQNSDCILGGSVSQIKKIINSLKFQPFSMKVLAEELERFIAGYNRRKSQVVGILNLTKDSFSDGGLYYNFEDAVAHLNELIDDGADIIDIGAESTRPYSSPVSAEEQLEKIVPILKYINNKNINIPISIDTRLSSVAQAAIDFGVAIINDVSGFTYDDKLPAVISDNDVKVIIQHSQGTPDVMQDNPIYDSVIDEVYCDFVSNKLKFALEFGIKKENIILDVGIGFGKTKEQNYQLIKHIKDFKYLGYPVMLGLSRKTLLDMPNASNEEKDIYTLALNTIAIEHDVDYLRVHNVKLHKRLIELMNNFSEE